MARRKESSTYSVKPKRCRLFPGFFVSPSLDHQLPFWKRCLRTNSRRIAQLRRRANSVDTHLTTWRHRTDEDIRARWKQLSVGDSQERPWNNPDPSHIILERLALAALSVERVTGLAPYSVQIIGALALLDNRLIEMRTGEGKTLTALMAALVRAADGSGVHIITVNDYLAQRDAALAALVGAFLGVTAAAISSLNIQMTKMSAEEARDERRHWYKADIVYATATEVGFDWLRDHMALKPEYRVLRNLFMAIVDEADSVLIDEARMPLVISGRSSISSNLYQAMNGIAGKLIRQQTELSDGDYWVDEKEKNVVLSEDGMTRAEEAVRAEGLLMEGEGLWHLSNLSLVSHLLAALKANSAYQRDLDYLVRQKEGGADQDSEVLIVDERTGRARPGHRWNEGLHQAIEAKEGVSIQPETQPRATVSIQQLFRQYEHLCGMTGTAATESDEFADIYGLEVLVLPTHRPMIRTDETDAVFMDQEHKNKALTAHIIDIHRSGRPILVGTGSIADNEEISDLLQKQNIPHHVLNAKEHKQEAAVVAQAGRFGAITLATNMAGRGTDIVLGGDIQQLIKDFSDEYGREPDAAEYTAMIQSSRQEREKVVACGGLLVIGSERHSSRRVDQQLRGRAGRQGDPGSSRFYVSFDDPLIRTFASARSKKALAHAGVNPEIPVRSKLVTWKITDAQKQMEIFHSAARKVLMDYDSVLQEQREVFYDWRDDLLDITSEQLDDYADSLMEKALINQVIRINEKSSVNEILCQLNLPIDWVFEHLEPLVDEAFKDEDHCKLIDVIKDSKEIWASHTEKDIQQTEAAKEKPLIDRLKRQNFDRKKSGDNKMTMEDFSEWRRRAEIISTALGDFGSCTMTGMDEIQRGLFFWLIWTRWKEFNSFSASDRREKIRTALLMAYDQAWRSHLISLDLMRAGIHLRGYAQENPRHAYRYEAFSLFQHMLTNAQEQAAQNIMLVCHPIEDEKTMDEPPEDSELAIIG